MRIYFTQFGNKPAAECSRKLDKNMSIQAQYRVGTKVVMIAGSMSGFGGKVVKVIQLSVEGCVYKVSVQGDFHYFTQAQLLEETDGGAYEAELADATTTLLCNGMPNDPANAAKLVKLRRWIASNPNKGGDQQARYEALSAIGSSIAAER